MAALCFKPWQLIVCESFGVINVPMATESLDLSNAIIMYPSTNNYCKLLFCAMEELIPLKSSMSDSLDPEELDDSADSPSIESMLSESVT